MINEKMIKIFLFVGLMLSLFIYHGLTFISEYYLNGSNNNITSLMTISRILVTSIIIFLTLRWNWLVSIILGDAYISGHYKGISRQELNPNKLEYNEDFNINQSILWTRISGRTHFKNGSISSNWKGKLIQYDDDREFRFAVELQTSNGSKWGILTLRINQGEVSGFYFPTETTEQNFISTIEGFKQPKVTKNGFCFLKN